jgi:ABC-2 type transport system ATP-binding protein
MLRYVAVIEVSELTKRYGRQVAVDGISFTVEEGEIFGILGPNGAGKTTAVECVAGLRQPDSGELIERLGLAGKRDTAFGKLSGGQKQRLSVALAL